MPEIMPILAENDGGKSVFDALQTIFVIVIALISLFGSVAGKFLKNKKSGDDDDAPEVDESVFGSIEDESGDDGNAPRFYEEESAAEEEDFVPANARGQPAGYGNVSRYDEIQQTRRRQTEQARADKLNEIRTRLLGIETRPAAPTTTFPQTAAPAKKNSPAAAPDAVSVPAEKIAGAQTRKNVPEHKSASGLLDDREALRRAVLAQEILSPPLALRE